MNRYIIIIFVVIYLFKRYEIVGFGKENFLNDFFIVFFLGKGIKFFISNLMNYVVYFYFIYKR